MTFIKRSTVWVVEDSPLEAESTRRALVDSCDVELFHDGPPLIERLSMGEPPPEVILLDWVLPGPTGIEVCRFLRQRWDEAELPILILTVRGAKEDIVEALSSGANDYLPKPFSA